MLLGGLVLTLLLRYVLPLLDPGVVGWRPIYEGEALMLSWNLYNGLVVAVAVLACIDRPNRRATDRFPIARIGYLELAGRTLWGTTRDLSEEGASFALECAHGGLEGGMQGQLQLMEPPLQLDAEVVRAGREQVALRFITPDDQTSASLIGLLYSGDLWFHRPRRLSISDALLHWLGSLWRAEPIRQSFD
jgi:cellulose synthase (UDP-forming)